MLPNFQQREVWPFNEPIPYKVLPTHIYDCDEIELHSKFVADFPDSNTRSDIYDGFMRLRADAGSYNINLAQWVDGSFISTKQNPSDVDVVHFVGYDEFNNYNVAQREFADAVLDGGEDTKQSHKSHSFLVMVCDSTHPYFPIFEAMRQYWLKWWGHTRKDQNTGREEPKGFLAMEVGNGSHPTISNKRPGE